MHVSILLYYRPSAYHLTVTLHGHVLLTLSGVYVIIFVALEA